MTSVKFKPAKFCMYVRWRHRLETFGPGHRIRLEVSSSNFPRFDRNLNTGGKNYDEAKGVVAHNAVHHARQYPSEVKLTVVKK